jgi:8-oxo-dGTP pyrophosphatase MutT (NUDIX family)
MSTNVRLRNLRAMNVREMRALVPRHKIRCGILMINSVTGDILTVCEQKREDLNISILGVPKGTLDETDASLYACATREFREETGIDLARIENYRLNTRIIFYNQYFHDILVLFIIMVKTNIVINRATIDSYEIASCAWISPIELLRIDKRTTPVDIPKYLRRLLIYIIMMITQYQHVDDSKK